ncbi:MAG: methyl-accepting chemotaxis protein [Bacteroidales bacterium]|nr:methyl-accepting chemotaxis protein [Bacteroidales bacterium]
MKSLSILSDNWDEQDQIKYRQTCQFITDTLFALHHNIIDNLVSIDKYNDPNVMFEIIPLVSDNGTIITMTGKALSDLNTLIFTQKSKADLSRAEMEDLLTRLKNFILYTSIFLVFVSLILAFLTVRSLVVPINMMKSTLLMMSKGILPNKQMEERRDELGEMSVALNSLVTGQKKISDFALEIGRGNYNTPF